MITVVPHHKEVATRNDDIELDGRWLHLHTILPGTQVVAFLQGLAVDGEATSSAQRTT